MKKEYNVTIPFIKEEIKELKQFFNLILIVFTPFLSMILKTLLFEMYHKAIHEREKINHYDFTWNDETDLKLQKIIKNGRKYTIPL